MGDTERWHLERDGVAHAVEVRHGALSRELVWTRDAVELARRMTSDDTVVLAPDGADGALRLRFAMVGPARRVTLHASEAEAHTGLAGADLEPEPGSKAAERAEWIGRHPHLHTARQTALAAAGVGVPVLLVWLLSLVPWPSIDVPWPDLPSIPWPDVQLPSIPWPDVQLPAIPWPDVDLPSLPAWTEPVRKFLVPVFIAFVIARGGVRRRRTAEERRRLGAEPPERTERTEQGQ